MDSRTTSISGMQPDAHNSKHPHGFGIDPDFDHIPAELRPGRWCVWQAMPKKKGVGFDKVPSDGSNWISTKDADRWLTFQQAVEVYSQQPGRWNGIGRKVEQDGFIFLDVDNVEDFGGYLQMFPTYW